MAQVFQDKAPGAKTPEKQLDLVITDLVITNTGRGAISMALTSQSHPAIMGVLYNGPDEFSRIYNACYNTNNICYNGQASRLKIN